MELTPAQKIINKDSHRFKVICCGRRFGKTEYSTLDLAAHGYSKNDMQLAYIAPTYPQARDIAWDRLKKIVGKGAYKINDSRLEIILNTQFCGLSTIVLKSWENIESLRGLYFDKIVLDEVAMMRNFERNWQEIIRPTLTDKKGSVLFISTPKGFNHFYDLYNLEKTDSDYKSFHFTTYDNPYIPIEEINKAKKEMNEDRFAQEYLADFRKTEGLVYKEFDRSRHIYKKDYELPKINNIFSGLDFGFTNPFAFLIIKKDYDGNYWIDYEIYESGQTDGDIANRCKQAKEKYKFEYIYPDPEAPEKIEKLKREGIHCKEVKKGKGSVAAGINIIRDLFKQNKIKINELCSNLIWELETYHYPYKSKTERNEAEDPVKENDHLVDALRYALVADSTNIALQIRSIRI